MAIKLINAHKRSQEEFMLTEERYEKILEIIEDRSYVSAAVLSKELFVSLPTIRRDLAELQRRGLILRSHGGAGKLNSEHTVIPLNIRKTVNYAEKRRLCQATAALIQTNDIIFIDASTTTLQLADFISPQKGVTVVTNGIPLTALLTRKGIKTYCTGGELQQNSSCYAGSFAEMLVRNFNFDIMFFSSHGINEKGIITDTSFSETALRKAAIAQSEKTAFLFTGTKISLSAPYNLMPLSDADYLITDKSAFSEKLPVSENFIFV